MKYGLLLAAILCSTSMFAQHCNCLLTLDSAKAYLERNYAGFGDKIIATSKAAVFEMHTNKLRLKAKATRSDLYCNDVLEEWLNFFKDDHLYPEYRADTSAAGRAQYLENTEKIVVTPVNIDRLAKGTADLEITGIYHTADSNYKVAVVENKNEFRDYAAVIIQSKVPGWNPGDLKFELVKKTGTRYRVIWYDRQHKPIFTYLDFDKTNGLERGGWLKENPIRATVEKNNGKPIEKNTGENIEKNIAVSSNTSAVAFAEENLYPAFFKQIDDSTSYLRIRNFGSELRKQIDSVVTANSSAIERSPYLVIDLRNNGGGADISYRPLKRLIYTNPVKTIGLDIIATKENLDNYTALIKEAELPAADEKEYLDLVQKARLSGQRDFNFFEDAMDTLKEVLPFPSKVAVIVNSRVGSTAEQFLFEAKQSKKVKLYGTHSQGVLDYANVCVKKFDCRTLELHYPISRSRRIDQGQAIDNVGLKPDKEVDLNKSNWLNVILTDLKK